MWQKFAQNLDGKLRTKVVSSCKAKSKRAAKVPIFPWNYQWKFDKTDSNQYKAK